MNTTSTTTTTTPTYPHQEDFNKGLSPFATLPTIIEICKRIEKTRLELLQTQKDEFPSLVDDKEKIINQDLLFTNFHNWLFDKKATSLKFGPIPTTTSHNGAILTRDVKHNELLCRIPLSKCLIANPDDAKNPDTLLGQWCVKSPNQLALSGLLQLTMLLLHERRLGNKSTFAPYLCILPQDFSNLPITHWSVDDIIRLGNTAENQPNTMKHVITCLRRSLSIMAFYFYGVHVAGLGSTLGSLREYLWAVAVISTRQNPCKISSSNNKNKLLDAPALIPGLDMINHSNQDSPMISTHQDMTDLSFEIKAINPKKEFKKDSEFTMFYGARTDTEFLIYQGFVATTSQQDINVNSMIEFILDVLPHQNTTTTTTNTTNDELYKLRAALLRNMPGVTILNDNTTESDSTTTTNTSILQVSCFIGGQFGLSTLLACARAATMMNKQQGAAMLKSMLSANTKNPIPIDITQEQLLWCKEQITKWKNQKLQILTTTATTTTIVDQLIKQFHQAEIWLVENLSNEILNKIINKKN
jgi:hypothetical protein